MITDRGQFPNESGVPSHLIGSFRAGGLVSVSSFDLAAFSVYAATGFVVVSAAVGSVAYFDEHVFLYQAELLEEGTFAS